MNATFIGSSSSGSKARASTHSDDEDFFDDNDDIVILRPTSSAADVQIETSIALNKNTADMKSLNDALENAVKYISSANTKPNRRELFLTENRLLALIKKCRQNALDLKKEKTPSKMEVDGLDSLTSFSLLTNEETLRCYKSLFSVVQRVFQSYRLLSLSFKNEEAIAKQTTTSIPSLAPFSLDFNSLRRSYSLLFALPANVVDELERVIDLAVYALCISIRMMIKKTDMPNAEREIEQMMHALLVINELPILENTQYIGKCIKTFYVTVSELTSLDCAKIVRMWALWHADELKIFLNRAQQYISVCIMKKLGRFSLNQ